MQTLFQGDTTVDERRKRVREAILIHGLIGHTCGRREGVPVMFEDVFRQIYGEPL